MRLIFDIRTTNRSGIHRYGVSLVEELSQLISKLGYYMLVIHDMSDEEATKHSSDAPKEVSWKKIKCQNPFLRIDDEIRSYAQPEYFDFYYSTNYMCSRNLNIPFAYTVHDLLRLERPELSYSLSSFRNRFGESEANQLFEEIKILKEKTITTEKAYPHSDNLVSQFVLLNYKFLISRCSFIVVPSQTTKDSLANTFPSSTSKLTLIPGASALTPNQKNRKKTDLEVDKNQLRRKIGTSDFLLYVGNTNPHKRVPELIEAFAQANKLQSSSAKLVLVISDGTQARHAQDNIDLNGLGAHVKIMHNVSDSTLGILYEHCTAFVTASCYEGFCLPAVEALAYNAMVVAPKLKIFDEVLGDKYLSFDSENMGELKKVLSTVLASGLPCTLKGQPAQIHSWSMSADILLKKIMHSVDIQNRLKV